MFSRVFMKTDKISLHFIAEQFLRLKGKDQKFGIIANEEATFIFESLNDFIFMIYKTVPADYCDLYCLKTLCKIVADRFKTAGDLDMDYCEQITILDEIFNNGLKELANSEDILNYLEMESHEELIQEIIYKVSDS